MNFFIAYSVNGLIITEIEKKKKIRIKHISTRFLISKSVNLYLVITRHPNQIHRTFKKTKIRTHTKNHLPRNFH